MSLESVLGNLTNPSWLEVPNELVPHQGRLILSRNQSQSLRDAARQAIDGGDQRTAQNQLYVGLLFDDARFLADLQKQGILRISRLSYVAEPLTSIVSALLVPGLGLSATTTDYLQSVSNLYAVAIRVRAEYQTLHDWLTEEKETGIKSALAWLDFIFLKLSVGFHETTKVGISSRDPFFFTVEELAEGFSSLLALYGNEIGSLTNNPEINEKALLSGVYAVILNMAAHIATFREWEFMVDRMGYRLSPLNSNSEYTLHHPLPDFHRAVELGFIQVALQRLAIGLDSLGAGGKSFHDVASTLATSMEDSGLIQLSEQPTARFRFSFPAELLQATAQVGELFLEERQALYQASRDLLTPIQQILDFEVQEGLSFSDLFHVARMVHLIRSIAAAKLIPEMQHRPGLVFQSIIPGFEQEPLIDMLSMCTSKEKAEKAIAMWTSDIKKHVDIQYQPLVRAGSSTLLPANVFVSSNVYRNPLHVLRKRMYEDGHNDPLSQLLADTFTGKGHVTQKNFHYDSGEIDVLVMIDRILFAFECKNSLVPTGAHELMTSLDYVRVAADQLERFKQRFADQQFRDWIESETGFPIQKTTHLCTGIVLSNRMFQGWRENGHPVRGAYEIERFVDDGTISMGEESHRFWAGSKFSGEDVRRFLEEDITYSPLWKCLRTRDAKYEFDGCAVVVSHLHLDQLSVADHFGFVHAKKRLSEQQAAFEKLVNEYSMVDYYRQQYQAGGRDEE